jgi:Helix-turn-helix domain
VTGRVWSAQEVRELGIQTDLQTAASILGIGRGTAYDMARRGRFPTSVLRIGSRYVVPVAPLLELLGVAGDSPPPGHQAVANGEGDDANDTTNGLPLEQGSVVDPGRSVDPSYPQQGRR